MNKQLKHLIATNDKELIESLTILIIEEIQKSMRPTYGKDNSLENMIILETSAKIARTGTRILDALK